MKREGSRFTLIEILAALVVTSIAAMGVFRLQMIGMEAAVYSDIASRAAVLAESRIDEAIAKAGAAGEPPVADSGEFDVRDMNTAFRWRLDVEDGSGDFPHIHEDIRDLWLLTCRVHWGERGSERSIELKRYVWNHDIAQ